MVNRNNPFVSPVIPFHLISAISSLMPSRSYRLIEYLGVHRRRRQLYSCTTIHQQEVEGAPICTYLHASLDNNQREGDLANLKIRYSCEEVAQFCVRYNWLLLITGSRTQYRVAF